MGKIPDELRQSIAANIRAEREKKFPGRGGSKACAAAFSRFIGQNISPQQWSPWERGMRTPDEYQLRQIADFFGVTVEDLRRSAAAPVPPPPPPENHSPSALHIACTESDIIWQLHKVYSGQANGGRRVHLSLNVVLSEEKPS